MSNLRTCWAPRRSWRPNNLSGDCPRYADPPRLLRPDNFRCASYNSCRRVCATRRVAPAALLSVVMGGAVFVIKALFENVGLSRGERVWAKTLNPADRCNRSNEETGVRFNKLNAEPTKQHGKFFVPVIPNAKITRSARTEEPHKCPLACSDWRGPRVRSG